MVPDHHIARSADQSGFNVPKAKKAGTVLMCALCRHRKQQCSYTKNNTWPEPCSSCAEKGKKCSKPEFKARARRPIHTSHKEGHDSASQISVLPTNTPLLQSNFDDTAIVCCKQAIIFLSLDDILSTCKEELVDLAADMMRPFQRHSQREIHDDNIPELSAVLNELNQVSQVVNDAMKAAAGEVKGTTLILAQLALRMHHFRHSLSWDIHQSAIPQCRQTIDHFARLGHTSLAYVLQARLLRENIQLSDSDLNNMVQWKGQFVAEVDAFFKTTFSKFTARQMFVPKELVRIPAFGDAISLDGRPDYLERSVTQIRLDAGLASKWSPNDFHHRDILGRTVLHQAIHRRCESVISKLPTLRQALAQCCMNGLSPLHIAACQGHTELVKQLMYLRPDIVDARDAAGRTAFWYAARGSQYGVMRVMGLQRNVDIDRVDKYGFSPAFSAVRDGRFEVLGYLIRLDLRRMNDRNSLKAGRSINPRPLLFFASAAGQTDCVDLLLEPDVRTWKNNSDEHRDLLNQAKQQGHTKLEGKLWILWNRKLDAQSQGVVADAGRVLLEPGSAGRAVPSYPYTFTRML